MTEKAPIAETPLTPPQAIQEYLSIGAGCDIGAADVDTYATWQAAVRGSRLQPPQKLHAGWISIEKGYRVAIEAERSGLDLSAATPEVHADLDEADKILSTLTDKPGINASVQAKALIARTGIPLFRALLTNEPQHILDGFYGFYNGLFSASELLLKNYGRFKNPADVPYLHAVTGMILMSQQTNDRKFALPAPARALEATSEVRDSWSFTFWSTEQAGSRLYRIRMAEMSAAGIINIPLSLLRNDEYPSSFGLGTLQALIDDNKKNSIPRFARGVKKPVVTLPQLGIVGPQDDSVPQYSKADSHIRTVYRDFSGRIDAFIKNEGAYTERVPDKDIPLDPSRIYLDIGAHRHISTISPNALSDLIKFMAQHHMDGILPPSQQTCLGWLHAESMMKEVIEGETLETKPSLLGAIHQAKDIFASAVENFASCDENDRNLLPEAEAAYIASAAYKEVYLGVAEEDKPFIPQMAAFATRLLETFQTLEDYSTPLAYEINRQLHMATVVLAVAAETNNDHIAATCSLRQRGFSEKNKNGWDLNVWAQDVNGNFQPDLFGKIKIAQEDNTQHSINSNVITITADEINPDGNFSVLCNLIDLLSETGEAQNNTTARAVAKIMDKVASALETSTW